MGVGVIVAGGFSTRFGERDKAFAEVGGRPMVRHVAERIATGVDALVVNCRADQVDRVAGAMDGYRHPVETAVDEVEGRGPVGGIERGLRAVPEGTAAAFVVACDMPFVEVDLVGYLVERFHSTGGDAVVPRSSDGWVQVLHAVYDPGAMAAACRTAIDRDERKVLAPLSYLETTVLDPSDLADHGTERSFENVNTPDDLEAARAAFADGR